MASAAASKAPRKRDTKGLTMGDLMARFRCEDACREYLEQLRWPDGPGCPRCKETRVGKLKGRDQYECYEKTCGYHFSVTAGTKLHDSHLPLWKWFLVTFLMIHAKKGMSAKQIQRMVGGSYKTAWYLCHRIRAAMKEVDSAKLTGEVEVDETFIGGEAPQREKYDNKSVVMAAVQRDSGRVRFRVVPDRKKTSIKRFAEEVIDGKAEAIYTDEWRNYRGIGDHDTKHETVRHAPYYDREEKRMRRDWVHGKVHTNTVEGVFSLLKRAIIGSYHKVGKQHLQAYLDEVSFKYNHRGNPYLFRETLKALILSDPLEYKDLTKG